MKLEGAIDSVGLVTDIAETTRELSGVFSKYFPKTSEKIVEKIKPVLEKKGFRKITKLNYIGALKIILRTYPAIVAADSAITPEKYFDAFKSYQKIIESTLKVEKREVEDAIAYAESKRKSDRDEMVKRLNGPLRDLIEKIKTERNIQTIEDLRNFRGFRYFLANTFSPTAEELNVRSLEHDPEFFEEISKILGFQVSIADIKADFLTDAVSGRTIDKDIKEIYAMPEAKKVQGILRDNQMLEMFEVMIAVDKDNPLFEAATDMFRTIRNEEGEVIRRPIFNIENLGLYDWENVEKPIFEDGITPKEDIKRAERLKEDQRKIAEAEEKLKNIQV